MKKICISNLMRHCEEASPTRQSKFRTLDCFAKARNDEKKSGFTLVELSIVLVIIGLLIGGILVGQSLIDSAKLQNEVRKIVQWQIAITQFTDKFKQYPGDSNLFEPAGNNNGYTGNYSGACPTSRVYESYSAWSHLTLSKMLIGEQYVWDSANIPECGGSTYSGMVPLQNFKNYFGNELVAEVYASRNGLNFAGKKYEYSINYSYKFYDSLAIEKKLDDGVPSTSSGRIGSDTETIGVCDLAMAQNEVISYNLSSVKDVFCYNSFYFNQHEIITPN